MYEAVLHTCQKFESSLSNWPEFVSQFSAYTQMVNDLRELNKEHKLPISNFTENKKNTREALTEYYTLLAANLKSFAISTEHYQMLELAGISISRLLTMKEYDCLAFSNEFADLIQGKLPDLARLNINQAEVDDLTALADAFKALISTPRNATTA